jgi:hypothetical protein
MSNSNDKNDQSGAGKNQTEKAAIEKVREGYHELILDLEQQSLGEVDNPVRLQKFDTQQEKILNRLERFENLIVTALNQEREDWVNSVADGLADLQEKSGISAEDLSQNEGFKATFFHANEIAARTHHKEKLEALRNAVINAAVPNAPDSSVQILLLNKLDALLPAHLRVLELCKQKKKIDFMPHYLISEIMSDLVAKHLLKETVTFIMKNKVRMLPERISDKISGVPRSPIPVEKIPADKATEWLEVSEWGETLLDFIKAYNPEEK